MHKLWNVTVLDQVYRGPKEWGEVMGVAAVDPFYNK